MQLSPAVQTWQRTPSCPHAAAEPPLWQRFTESQHPLQFPAVQTPPSTGVPPPSSLADTVVPASLEVAPPSFEGEAPLRQGRDANA